MKNVFVQMEWVPDMGSSEGRGPEGGRSLPDRISCLGSMRESGWRGEVIGWARFRGERKSYSHHVNMSSRTLRRPPIAPGWVDCVVYFGLLSWLALSYTPT